MSAGARLVLAVGGSFAAGFLAMLTLVSASSPTVRARVEIVGHKATNDTIVVTVSITNIGNVILEDYAPNQNSFQYVEWQFVTSSWPILKCQLGASSHSTLVGAWFLAHRHGQLRGAVDANKSALGDPLAASGAKTPLAHADRNHARPFIFVH